MNLTYDKSKFSHDQLMTIENMKQKIKSDPKNRAKNLNNLFNFWRNKLNVNFNNDDEWNYFLYYFMDLGFSYSEILKGYMDFTQ